METTEAAGQPKSQSPEFVPEDILDYLFEMGIVDTGSFVEVSSLSGGVSNDVLAVTSHGVDVVVKHALSKLKVEADWFASPDRVITEAKALQTAGALIPDNVPPVLGFDTARKLMVIERAPRSSYEWKTDLMAGKVDDAIAVTLGRVLARLHRQTAYDPALSGSFGATDAFVELRVDPFYRYVAVLHPDVREVIDGVIDRMMNTATCLVHGDFSPKNVLVGIPDPWVIDWEVAHIGDPTFDVAFLITHLLCKSLYRPESREAYRKTGDAFLRAYTESIGDSIETADEEYLAAQIACLLLARIDGKSPAPYLDEAARTSGRIIALEVLSAPSPSLDDLWAVG